MGRNTMKTFSRLTGLMLYLWGISVFIMMVPATGQALTVSGDTVENTSEGGNALLVQKSVGASGSPIIHGEAADGTLESPTATPSNRTLLSIGGAGYTGSAWTQGSSTIRFRATEPWSETGQGSEITFSTTPNGSTAAGGRTERMRITTDGKVGIGTTVPSEALTVFGNVSTNGFVSASSFLGSGALLTNLNPANMTSGTANINILGNATSASNANTLEGQSASDIISAASDEVRTPISSLPYPINSSGSYYLTSNLTSTGDGITVNADNVTIDFNGFTMTGPGKSSATGYGVYMDGRKNVEIKNGTIREFGYDGIRENNNPYGQGHRIIHMRVEDNGGPFYYGIFLSGKHHLIRDCLANSNGNSGINVGAGATVTGNTTSGNGDHGMIIGSGSTVTGNTISYNASHGIYASYGSTIKNNTAYHNGWYGIYLMNYDFVDGNCAYDNNTVGGYGNISPCLDCVFGSNVGL
jgi:hypothetical protein